MIFRNSGIDFGRQNQTKIDRKMISKITCLNLIPFGPKSGHKIPPRLPQDAHRTPQEASKTSQDTPRTAPRRPKMTPKTLPGRLQNGSKTPPRQLQNGLGPHELRQRAVKKGSLGFGSIFTDFGTILTRCWVDFRLIFAPF